MNNRVTLVIGGVRSGKSRFAAGLATKLAAGGPVRFIATARPGESGHLAERIRRHRAERPPAWRTIETPLDVGEALARPGKEDATIVDCLTVWISNLLLECGDADSPDFEDKARSRVKVGLDGLMKALRSPARPTVIVANEVGQGVAPPTRLGVVFADLQGEVSQALARRADSVWHVVAGIPLRIKSPG